IAMEYVAGQTLDRQIPRTGMRIGRVVELGIQMADALAAAHSAGIVHRDFKPANVMASETGQVKVLDFGLAKLVERPQRGADEDGSTGLRGSSLHTDEGMILGTVAYMSPEQAQGREVDSRSDIFSFGAVLYEMVSGTRAFEGDSAALTLAAIIRDQPKALRDISPDVPPDLERIIRRCLNKEPERRYQSASDIRVELEELQAEARKSGEERRARRPWRKKALWLSTVAAGALGVATAAWWLVISRESTHGPSLGDRALWALTAGEGLQTEATWSPDAKYIAYAAGEAGNFDVFVEEVGGGDPGKLKGADHPAADDWQPDWSPVSRQIVFRSERDGGGLYTVSAPFGGEARLLRSGGYRPQWSPDGRRILFLENAGRGYSPRPNVLFLDGSEVKVVVKPEGESVDDWQWSARWHPDGRISILDSDGNRFWTQSTDGSGWVESGMKKQVAETVKKLDLKFSQSPPEFEWSPSGDALFFVASAEGVPDLWKVDVDPKTLEWRDGPHRLTTSPDREADLAVSRSGGRLAFSLHRTAVQFWSFPLNPGEKADGDRIPLTAPGVLLPQSD
ncbi:MAG: serine/threonine-protein kinase, partial [Acidobacteria bacterium]